ncbi:hypothetical protein GCM10011374_35610 [Kocuria dechangensis]|uniref:Uncharacterized protein n=1 Tax=Kocuria dechangensis TaxID=1176249 RepID=A0A917H5K1_9MICC|nr:hypothetical protein [Kocuria dechangensis]GGG68162.1 hypothetical protein GCM10011374_35610 [Kocuria dechangensis]
MKLLLATLVIVAIFVFVVVRMNRDAAARGQAAVAEVESTPAETIATWPEAKLRRTAQLLKTRRTLLGIRHGAEGQTRLAAGRIGRDLERAGAAELKLVEADRAAAGHGER